ncbi:Rne/Rng family ribonuclease [Schaalia canis]|uniref:Ribonuclease E n=1 Tax=Schaalia canis TaxID=100469 RepID=A0A3P1SHV6_9ACTO|nr:Rne/Rng family ribonuclease [Schaalia canis]
MERLGVRPLFIWRTVTTPHDTQDFPGTPAASLLFQAPTFQEPTFQSAPAFVAPTERPSYSDDDADEVPARKQRTRARRVKEAKETIVDTSEENGEDEAPKRVRKTRKARRHSDEEPAVEASNDESVTEEISSAEDGEDDSEGTSRRRRRRRTRTTADEAESPDEVKALKGSTRLEAKKQRRREGRKEGRRRHVITESEFLARRESVNRKMVIRHRDGLDQIAIIEDDLLVEHYVARRTQQSMVGNIYLGRVQNVLPSMEAAFVDIGRGRNAVLYAGEVNWDAVGLEGRPRRIESALNSGDAVLVQVTKDPIGHKGARLTSQITLAGRYLVLIPGGSMMGISRKLPDTERTRLKKILKKVVPAGSGVIVRTAAEGASEEQLSDDVTRLVKQWSDIEKKQASTKSAPALLRGEPELAVRVVRDIFNEDFTSLVIEGRDTYHTIKEYVDELSPELSSRVEQWVGTEDVFAAHRVDEQLAKGMDRKVWLPSGGTLVIDRTEAMTVIDVNTGKFIGAGGTLEETVTRNNLEAAEEIVRQLRLRDIGGIVIVDFVDMVLEQNRDLVLRRLVECLGRDRTRHQVTEITSLGLVQMTRKRVGEGLVEAFSTTCSACEGKGFIVHHDPVEHQVPGEPTPKQRKKKAQTEEPRRLEEDSATRERAREALSAIHAAASHTKDELVPTDDAATADVPADESALIAPSAAPAEKKSKARKGKGESSQVADKGRVDTSTSVDTTAASASTKKKSDTQPARDSHVVSDAPAKKGASRATRRRRVVSTDVVEPQRSAAHALIELPAPVQRPDEQYGETESAVERPLTVDAIELPQRGDEPAKTPARKRRRVVSADVVDPASSKSPAKARKEREDALAAIELPQAVASPEGEAAGAMADDAPKVPKRRRRAVSTGVIDAG